MLVHAGLRWNIVILTPTTKWVKEEDRVFKTLFQKLLASIFEEEDVAVV